MGTDKKDDNGKEVYDSDDFMTLYNLVSHHDSWNFKEHAYKAYFALFFIRCLQKSNYFGEFQSQDRSLGPEEILIGKILIHLMEVATMNAHEIGQLEVESGKSWLQGLATPVGCALEPTLVLLNHSCTPALARINNGTESYCFASRHIKKGEEITDSYTYAYDVTPKITRSPVFENKYKFTCNCPACQENWEVFQNLPKGFNDLGTDQLKIKQQEMMKLKEYVERIQKLGAKIHKHQQNEEFCEAMQVYPDFLKALDAVIKPPHQFYAIARRSYSSCLWVQYGSKVRT